MRKCFNGTDGQRKKASKQFKNLITNIDTHNKLLSNTLYLENIRVGDKKMAANLESAIFSVICFYTIDTNYYNYVKLTSPKRFD